MESRGYGRGSSSTFSNATYLYSKEAGFVQQGDMQGYTDSLECVLVGEDLVLVAADWWGSDKDTKYFNLSTLDMISPHSLNLFGKRSQRGILFKAAISESNLRQTQSPCSNQFVDTINIFSKL